MTDPLAAVDPDVLSRLRQRRVALVHDWLTGMRGGERVLELLCRVFPGAEIFTLLHLPGSVSEVIESRPIHTSFVQRLPAAGSAYRWYLPLFPWAIESLDLAGFELVLSTSHCVAKAAVAPPGARHLCYCFTPMRYAWDQFDAYFGRQRVGPARHALIAATLAWLRRWDRATAERVDAFAADSRWVARRIDTYYGRHAEVIPPPVDTAWFTPGDDDSDDPADYYLVVSALNPYKRIDVAIEAFNRAGRPLLVVGTGPEERRLRELAGPTVELLGRVDDVRLRHLYRSCRALILPNVEDAGIVPLEAMACGRPAIVLDRGGAAELVEDGRTGILMRESTPEALLEAIDRAESVTFNTSELRSCALRNGSDVFAHRIVAFIDREQELARRSPEDHRTSARASHPVRSRTEAGIVAENRADPETGATAAPAGEVPADAERESNA